MVVPHISVWGSSFFGCHPARRGLPPAPPPPPPRLPLSSPRRITTLTHIQLHIILFIILFTSLHLDTSPPSHTYSSTSSSSSSSSPLPLTIILFASTYHHHPHTHTAPEGAAARVVAACCPPRGRRSTQSLQKGLRRALSPLVPLAVLAVAGALSRVFGRGCGARCRRWCRLLPSAWQAHAPEPPDGAAARVVAAGAAGCPLRGRRTLQSLQKGLRRALSPWCRWLPSAWQAQYPEPREGAAARVVAAGATGSRASRRGCGACCRRWCRWLHSAWQAQYPEPPEGAAARVVAAGAAGCPRYGRRTLQRLRKGLRRALSPLVPLAALRVAGAVPRALRRGCGARCRRWCRLLSSLWQADSLGGSGRGCGALLVPLAALAVAGAVPRASRRGYGARCRRWCRWLPAGWPRTLQSLQKELRRVLSPLVPLAALRVAGAVPIVIVRYCHCDLHSKGSHCFGIAL